MYTYNYFKKNSPLSLLKNNDRILGERSKRGKVRAESSDPKRTKRSFRCRVSIDRSTHPHSFIWRAGCHTSFGFPGGVNSYCTP